MCVHKTFVECETIQQSSADSIRYNRQTASSASQDNDLSSSATRRCAYARLARGKGMHTHTEWPLRQGGCLTCCGFTFEFSWVHWFILCARRSGGTAHEGGGCDQSIGSTVSDAIVRTWLWLTATSSPLGCFSILQVVDNWPHIPW